MVKRKSLPPASSTDENEDGWLNTRSKKKISQSKQTTLSAHHYPRRPFPRSPLVTLMDDVPLPLTATTKQTSIGDFFTPRLKDLPSTGSTSQNLVHSGESYEHEAAPLYSTQEALYSDFDMPGPTATPRDFGVPQTSTNFDTPTPSEPSEFYVSHISTNFDTPTPSESSEFYVSQTSIDFDTPRPTEPSKSYVSHTSTRNDTSMPAKFCDSQAATENNIFAPTEKCVFPFLIDHTLPECVEKSSHGTHLKNHLPKPTGIPPKPTTSQWKERGKASDQKDADIFLLNIQNAFDRQTVPKNTHKTKTKETSHCTSSTTLNSGDASVCETVNFVEDGANNFNEKYRPGFKDCTKSKNNMREIRANNFNENCKPGFKDCAVSKKNICEWEQKNVNLSSQSKHACIDYDQWNDSLQTPAFLNEIHSPLGFTDLGIDLASTNKRSQSETLNKFVAMDCCPTQSSETASLGFTDLKSIQFTEYSSEDDDDIHNFDDSKSDNKKNGNGDRKDDDNKKNDDDCRNDNVEVKQSYFGGALSKVDADKETNTRDSPIPRHHNIESHGILDSLQTPNFVSTEIETDSQPGGPMSSHLKTQPYHILHSLQTPNFHSTELNEDDSQQDRLIPPHTSIDSCGIQDSLQTPNFVSTEKENDSQTNRPISTHLSTQPSLIFDSLQTPNFSCTELSDDSQPNGLLPLHTRLYSHDIPDSLETPDFTSTEIEEDSQIDH